MRNPAGGDAIIKKNDVKRKPRVDEAKSPIAFDEMIKDIPIKKREPCPEEQQLKKKIEITKEEDIKVNKELRELRQPIKETTKEDIEHSSSSHDRTRTTEAEQKLIQAHYRNPLVKSIIMDHAREGNLWRAGNGDFVDWYRCDKDTARLFDITNLNDYDYLTTHHRTLYWTLNFFDEKTRDCSIPKTLHDEKGNKLTIGTFADTKTYSLGVDVDSGRGYSIMQADGRKAVEALAQFMADKFRDTFPVSTHAMFSCGGIYILLHHNLFTEKFKTDENRNLSWRILVDCFNAYIKDIESEFFEKYPKYKGKAKADAINNQKRVFKTILSVHKSYPFACIPIDVENVKIDIKKASILST